MSDEMIRFDRVSKRFGDVVVLGELDFAVRAGERVALIGPSGSGKTTILRLLMGLERVDSGTIHVGDQCLSHMRRGDRLVPADDRHLRQVRRRIGMVFQQFNLFTHLRVLDNLTVAQRKVLRRDRAEAEAVARRNLDRVG